MTPCAWTFKIPQHKLVPNVGHCMESSLWQVIEIFIFQMVEVWKCSKWGCSSGVRLEQLGSKTGFWGSEYRSTTPWWTVDCGHICQSTGRKTCFDISHDRNEYGFHTQVWGLWCSKWSILKYEKYCTHCKAGGKERLMLLIRGDRAVASWWMLMSMSIPWPGRCEDQQGRPVNIDELKGSIGNNPLTDLTGFGAHINKEIMD